VRTPFGWAQAYWISQYDLYGYLLDHYHVMHAETVIINRYPTNHSITKMHLVLFLYLIQMKIFKRISVLSGSLSRVDCALLLAANVLSCYILPALFSFHYPFPNSSNN
jgi:hypothetical protein